MSCIVVATNECPTGFGSDKCMSVIIWDMLKQNENENNEACSQYERALAKR
jgi:hypothetical protein